MNANPFAADIHPDGYSVESGAQLLHSAALGTLENLVAAAGSRRQDIAGQDGGGIVVLLKAPRAGFGKSHLIARLGGQLEDRAFVVPVVCDPDREQQWSPLLWQMLESFHQGRAGSLSLLDLIARRLFSLVNQRLIQAGQVPCSHPAEAISRLDSQFTSLFDFADPAQPVAAWFAEHFERLLPWSSEAFSSLTGLSAEPATHWLRILCAYAQAAVEPDAVRSETLRWSVLQPSATPVNQGGMSIVSAPPGGETGARERLVEFCRVAAAVRPLVLAFDDLDAFYQRPDAVQRIAGFITVLRQRLTRAVMVLSANQDLWTQTFLKALPSAIEDRLTGRQVTLSGLTVVDAESLVRSRLDGANVSALAAAAFMTRLNLAAFFAQEAGRMVSPRAVLRHSAQQWEEFITQARQQQASAADTNRPTSHATASTNDARSGEHSFQRLREKLDQIKASSRLQSEPGSSGAVIQDEQQEPTHAQIPVRVATLTPHESVSARYRQLVAHFQASPWLMIDHERIYHLLEETGRRMAVVRWSEVPVPGTNGLKAGMWTTPEAEILFGTEHADDRNYWSALNSAARQRSQQNSAIPCRLAVFSAVQSPLNLAAWMPPDEIIHARSRYLDLQPLERQELAALYAGDEILRDAARNALALNASDAFAHIAPAIEFLWKRLTRARSAAP